MRQGDYVVGESADCVAVDQLAVEGPDQDVAARQEELGQVLALEDGAPHLADYLFGQEEGFREETHLALLLLGQ